MYLCKQEEHRSNFHHSSISAKLDHPLQSCCCMQSHRMNDTSSQLHCRHDLAVFHTVAHSVLGISRLNVIQNYRLREVAALTRFKRTAQGGSLALLHCSTFNQRSCNQQLGSSAKSFQENFLLNLLNSLEDASFECLLKHCFFSELC